MAASYSSSWENHRVPAQIHMNAPQHLGAKQHGNEVKRGSLNTIGSVLQLHAVDKTRFNLASSGLILRSVRASKLMKLEGLFSVRIAIDVAIFWVHTEHITLSLTICHVAVSTYKAPTTLRTLS